MNQDRRKLPAGAGAEWLLSGFRLLRASPAGLGLLGAIFGLVTTGLTLAGVAVPKLMGPSQIVAALLGPLLLAGVIWAVREVDQGRNAQPGHFARAIHEGGVGRLLATLLPQLAAVLLIAMLLVALIGMDHLQTLIHAVEATQQQTRPDNVALSNLPFGRLLLWFLLALAIGIVAGFFNFTAIPQIVFEKRTAMDAMRRSFRACLRNLGALAVFFLLIVVTIIALGIVVRIVEVILGLIVGASISMFIGQVLMMAVLIPVMAGAFYTAWKQMQGPAQLPSTDAAPRIGNGGIEV